MTCPAAVCGVCVLPVQYIVILVVVLLAELSLIIFAALFPTMVRYYDDDDDDDDVSLTYTPYRYTLIIGAATCVSRVVRAYAKEFAPPQLFWRWELHSS